MKWPLTPLPDFPQIRCGLCLVSLIFLVAGVARAEQRQISIVAAEFENGQPTSVEFVNSLIGWDWFFTQGIRGSTSSIGMLEAGTAWTGHEVFVRPPDSQSTLAEWQNPAEGAANELDYHATMVAHVLAGTGYIPTNGGEFTFVGLGMAPNASLLSGGIATEFSSQNFGSFNISLESYLTAYRDFFTGNQLGQGFQRLDVINSSWGGGGDPAARSIESLSLDGLAYQNPLTAHVVAAGNSGANAAVGSPANGFNNISVGSTGGPDFLDPSSFSSGGLADFFIPDGQGGGTTLTGVRIAVDVAAPGENFYLAAYLGNTGGIAAALPQFVQQPSPTNLYFIEVDGTSFAAPMVAGGIALLKDLARLGLGESPENQPESFDTRVMKSILMASATPTHGWDNGQNADNITTQALDPRTGAGLINLEAAANIYLGQSFGVMEPSGGTVADTGWALSTISRTQTFADFLIGPSFTETTTLTVALNWFAVRDYDDVSLGQDVAFSNLNLEVWSLNAEGFFDTLIGASQSLYNNTEFLRLDTLAPGQYAMRVVFDDMIYDLSDDGIEFETYALAWSAVAIPEPHTCILLLFAIGSLHFRKIRHPT